MGTFKRDSAGIGRILKSAEVAALVDGFAGQVGSDIATANPGIEPGVHTYTTDRAVASVTVANGAALQARDGIFTRACAARGVEVAQK